jgi:hypothetical protein
MARAREAGGGVVLLVRIAVKAASFQSVKRSLSATDVKPTATLTTRFLKIGGVFIRCKETRVS